MSGNGQPFSLRMATWSGDQPTVVIRACGPSGFFLPITALFDTGSDMTLLTMSTGKALGITLWSQRAKNTNLVTIAGEPIAYYPALIHFSVDTEGHSPVCVSVHGGVTEILKWNLIGCDFLRQFDFKWTRSAVELKPYRGGP